MEDTVVYKNTKEKSIEKETTKTLDCKKIAEEIIAGRRLNKEDNLEVLLTCDPVSYTHLDVYKRQILYRY